MERKFENLKFVNYSWPRKVTDPVVVSLILPDGSKKTIGRICTDYSKGESSPTFLSLNATGKELFPPTKNYYRADLRFEKYALRLIQASQEKERNLHKEPDRPKNAEREGEIKSVRMRKGRNEKSKTINK